MLGEYLSKDHGEWNYKTHDCSKWMGGWIAINYGSCPLELAGINYKNEREAKVLLGRNGGLFELWKNGLNKLGFQTVKNPKAGDIAILNIPTNDGTNQTCGIWTGNKWSSVHENGTLFGVGEPLIIWSL